MKILLYNRHFFPSIGGTEISGRIMARELAALGHAVTVVTATSLPNHMAELDEGYEIVRNEKAATLFKLSQEHDVLLCRGGVSLRAFVASLRSGVPFVAFQEFDVAAGRTGGSFRRIITDGLKAFVRRRVSLSVVVSDALQEKLALPNGVEGFRLYNPVAEELWTTDPAGIDSRDLDVLFVGRLVTDKGLMVLRDALIALRRPSIRVAIAGDSSDRKWWEKAFREVVGEVAFLGPVAGESLRDLYARARIVVMPSTVIEGMGMVAAEAIASGTPVCASDQPALREVVADSGLFHPAGDAERLADHIERLLDDAELWTTQSDYAKIQRLKFSMKRYRENLTSLIGKMSSVNKSEISTPTAESRKTRILTEDKEEKRQ